MQSPDGDIQGRRKSPHPDVRKTEIGEPRHASGPDGDLDLRLHAVRTLKASERAGGFSLTFVGTPDPLLSQAIYPLTNERLGAFEVVFVPIGPTEGDNGYGAVFA